MRGVVWVVCVWVCGGLAMLGGVVCHVTAATTTSWYTTTTGSATLKGGCLVPLFILRSGNCGGTFRVLFYLFIVFTVLRMGSY